MMMSSYNQCQKYSEGNSLLSAEQFLVRELAIGVAKALKQYNVTIYTGHQYIQSLTAVIKKKTDQRSYGLHVIFNQNIH